MLKYKVGDIVQFKHWIWDNTLIVRKNEMIVENGIIVGSSDKWEYNWIAKSFKTNQLIYLKEDWITKLNEDQMKVENVDVVYGASWGDERQR